MKYESEFLQSMDDFGKRLQDIGSGLIGCGCLLPFAAISILGLTGIILSPFRADPRRESNTIETTPVPASDDLRGSRTRFEPPPSNASADPPVTISTESSLSEEERTAQDERIAGEILAAVLTRPDQEDMKRGLRRLIERYPETSAATSAREKLDALDD